MTEAYRANYLPLDKGAIDQSYFMEELIDATAKLEVYKEKIKDSKIDSAWFMPTLQQKEALASSQLEGTQATLDGVLVNQISPNDRDKNLNEVKNYYLATIRGLEILSKEKFSDDFFFNIHNALMQGNVRKPSCVGEYRTEQNYIGKNDKTHAITFVPPVPEDVPALMNNLIDYMNSTDDTYRPLVRTAIIHAQFETIHPFMDGNGRVGELRMVQRHYEDKNGKRQLSALNIVREEGDWNEWIKFFLTTVIKQCDKYIQIISEINDLYSKDKEKACNISRSSNMVDVIDALYQYPITTAKQISEVTNIPTTSVNRYLGQLVESKLLFTDTKGRNRTYFYLGLLSIIRA